MQETIHQLRQEFQEELQAARTTSAVELMKVKYLGKKGPVQQLMQKLREAPSDQRAAIGKNINDLKEQITQRLDHLYEDCIQQEESDRLQQEKIDATLPGRRRFAGRKHIVTQVMDEMIDILRQMGFSVQYGPDIETDYYNFEALNFPPIIPLATCKTRSISPLMFCFAPKRPISKYGSWKLINPPSALLLPERSIAMRPSPPVPTSSFNKSMRYISIRGLPLPISCLLKKNF